MWEQRYGFPAPQRTAGGYRRYTQEDVRRCARCVRYRHRGLSVPAAIERAQRPAGRGPPVDLRRRRRGRARRAARRCCESRRPIACSRAISTRRSRIAACAGPVRRLPARALLPPRRAALAARGRACRRRPSCSPTSRPAPSGRRSGEVPIAPADALGNEWAVIVDAPGTPPACSPGSSPARRRPEAPTTATGASRRSGRSTPARPPRRPRGGPDGGRGDPASVSGSTALLADRPLALDQPAPALTALANRVVAYLES